MASSNLTVKQSNVVIAIRNFAHIHGYPPTIRELAQVLDRARGTVVQHIAALEKKRVLRHAPRKARSIEILQAA